MASVGLQTNRKIKGGIYVQPSYLSADARDLVSRMLVVNPLKRISVPDIRQHPWFVHDLPAYLKLSAVEQTSVRLVIDQEIVDQLVKLNFQRDKIFAALAMHRRLLTVKTAMQVPHLKEARNIMVGYDLLLDRKRKANKASMIQPGAEPEFVTEENLAAPVPVPYYDPNKDTEHNLTHGMYGKNEQEAIPLGRWYLGQWSRIDPQVLASFFLSRSTFARAVSFKRWC